LKTIPAATDSAGAQPLKIEAPFKWQDLGSPWDNTLCTSPPSWGWWLGFLLSVIGVVIVACLPRTEAAKLRTHAQAQDQAGYGQWQEPGQ